MFIKHSLFVLSCLVVVSLAEECQNNWRQIRKRLNASKAKWALKASSPSCYSMTLEKQCFCTEEYRGPHALEIVDGVVQDTSMFATEMPTVSELFDLVEKYCVKDCPESGAASCRVRFDRELGYVKELWIDVSALIADEEIGYFVSNVQFCE
ncbi:hypothetical protein MPSEU_000107200 [Mayamaea pseudoterrestris]|nr:hypothetical protein MPSEU_000107200 [Mayamaea pseudoterrestris]